jgi:hypothetical protein
VNVNGTYVTALPGMVITTNSISMNNTALSFLVPATPNEHFDLSMVLYGSAVPGPGSAVSPPSSIADDFFGTVTLTSINFLDSQGAVVSGARVLRDSDAAVAATPEPGGVLLAGAALAALALLRIACSTLARSSLWRGPSTRVTERSS